MLCARVKSVRSRTSAPISFAGHFTSKARRRAGQRVNPPTETESTPCLGVARTVASESPPEVSSCERPATPSTAWAAPSPKGEGEQSDNKSHQKGRDALVDDGPKTADLQQIRQSYRWAPKPPIDAFKSQDRRFDPCPVTQVPAANERLRGFCNLLRTRIWWVET
jgi:hypothetical protein